MTSVGGLGGIDGIASGMAHQPLLGRLTIGWASASLWALLLLSACSAGPDPESADPGSSATTDISPSISSTYDPVVCRSKQKGAVAALEWPILQEVWRVMASPPEGSGQAAQRIRSSVDAVGAKVAANCGGESSATDMFVGAVRAVTDSNLDDSGTRSILDAYSEWASAVSAPDNLEGIAESLAFCDRFEEGVRAAYAVWEEPAPYGKRSWVQLIIENDTSKRYWAELGGELWATDLRPDLARGHPRDPKRGGHQWVWGGSSADSMYALPGVRSTRPVGIGEFQYLYMKPDGEVYGVRPEVMVRANGHTCSLPVTRDK